MSNQTTQEPQTVYWSPQEQITITGTELAALLHLVDLQTVNLSQIPLQTLMEMFTLATKAKNDIMNRLAEEGKLTSEPAAEVITVD